MALDKKFNFILGSGSPRRKELLSWLNISFSIMKAEVEEYSEETNPEKYVEEIALQKLEAIWRELEREGELEKEHGPFLVCADTIVSLNNKIYGKPVDREDAKRILLELSGQTHQVYSSVVMRSILDDVCTRTFTVKSDVTFDQIGEGLLEAYLDTGESLDKAGAYGIQGAGLSFISNLSGSYSNVVGFPLSHFNNELRELLKIEKNKDLTQYFIG